MVMVMSYGHTTGDADGRVPVDLIILPEPV